MSNIYRTHFVSRCPNNRQLISYLLEIDTDEMIHVEHITTATAMHESGYHEAIADDLFKRFGGRQILKAHHHGVDIETRRGFDPEPCGRLTERVQIGKTVYEKGVEAIHAIRAASR
ncbi:hypothetical protein [Burkholderia vietnamiensis]|uniref:hypothetical protein n=1 Tax=Burkholderia vietnamiensis TaxID=60552 RepID=UPI0007C678A8|nr:hypothetical protein [Burkholderia vietnamiensis]